MRLGSFYEDQPSAPGPPTMSTARSPTRSRGGARRPPQLDYLWLIEHQLAPFYRQLGGGRQRKAHSKGEDAGLHIAERQRPYLGLAVGYRFQSESEAKP
jgi:hypothetical protein